MQPQEFRSNGAAFLAAAVCELFPGTQLVRNGTTQHGFFGDFTFPFDFHESMITLIEEKMRRMIQEERPIQHLEMVPISAAGFLNHRGQPLKAKEAETSKEALLQVVQIGDFADLCKAPVTHDIGHFKLQKVGKESLIGFTFPSKDELKQFLKAWKPVQDYSFLKEFLNEGIWMPKGEKLRQKLISDWQEALKDFSVISTPNHTLADHKKVGGRTAEIFYNEGYRDRAYAFCPTPQLSSVCNSCLQIIVKFLTMLRFEFEMFVRENVVEFRLFDSWGRPWAGPFVGVETEAVVMSLFGQMEQFVTLYLEKEEL